MSAANSSRAPRRAGRHSLPNGQLTAAAAGLFDRSRSAMEAKADTWRTHAGEVTTAGDDSQSKLNLKA